jgi:CheY-like chemotaxis protein
MNVLFIDDEAAARRTIKHLLEKLGHTVTVKSNGEQVLDMPAAELEKIDVAIIDKKLPGNFDGFKVGEALKQRKQEIILMMLTAHGTIADLALLLREGLFRDFLEKPVDIKSLDTALLRVESEVTLRRENELLRQQISAQQAPSQFLDCTRQLLGINDVLLDIERRVVKPYSDWLSGEWDSYAEDLRPEFVTSLLFEGEPGSGKTAICKAIARTFESPWTVLERDLAPGENPGRWREPLNNRIREYYALATGRRVVVIRADDLVWPEVGKMGDSALAADWISYMNTLREYLEDAGVINKGESPRSNLVRAIGRTGRFNGKILWLFARNTAEDVGGMFRPLKNLIRSLSLSFPRAPEMREQILVSYAAKAGWIFEPTALKLAVREMQGYSGRDLIGDENSVKGFIKYVIESVKERERLRQMNGLKTINRLIRMEEVKRWLDSPEHKYIMSQMGEGRGERDCLHEEAAKKYYLDGLDQVRANLDIIEILLGESKPPADIGKAIYGPISNPRISLNNFWRNATTKNAFASTPENEARDRWPRVIDYIVHKHPKIMSLYPAYVKERKL